MCVSKKVTKTQKKSIIKLGKSNKNQLNLSCAVCRVSFIVIYCHLLLIIPLCYMYCLSLFLCNAQDMPLRRFV